MRNEASTVSEDLQVICGEKIAGSIPPCFNTKKLNRESVSDTQNEEYCGSIRIKVAVSH